MVYMTGHSATHKLGGIAVALGKADVPVPDADPDREAIAWQVLSWLQGKSALEGKPLRRVEFQEATRKAGRWAVQLLAGQMLVNDLALEGDAVGAGSYRGRRPSNARRNGHIISIRLFGLRGPLHSGYRRAQH